VLPKQRRLFRRDFLIAKSTGKTSRFSHLSLVVHPNDLGFSRIAVVTSAKLDKRAVIRNKIRRRIYACLKDFAFGADIIVFPNKSMLNLSRDQISLELNQALSKIAPHGGP